MAQQHETAHGGRFAFFPHHSKTCPAALEIAVRIPTGTAARILAMIPVRITNQPGATQYRRLPALPAPENAMVRRYDGSMVPDGAAPRGARVR